MEFSSSAQKACYEKVVPWLKEIFGHFMVTRDDKPMVGVAVGSAFAQVAVLPWGDDDATVTTRAYVVTGVEATPDLMKYLLQKNTDTMMFGAFGLDHEGDIVLEHTLICSSCDKEELKASVMSVVTMADKYDDEIVARWGGVKALDKLRG